MIRKVFKSKVVVKLGEGAIHKNEIAPLPFQRGIKALRHYKKIIGQHKPEKVFAFATSAIRSAINGKDFTAAAIKETGLHISVIPGTKEAELIYYGVRQCVEISDKPSLIMDIGGGSTEFIIANNKKIYWKHSYNIGAARLLELFKPSDPVTLGEVHSLQQFLSGELKDLFEAVRKYQPTELIGSSGSFDTFADMIGRRFHGRNITGSTTHYRFKMEEYAELHQILLKSTTRQRMKMPGLIKMRVDMIVLASICTTFVLEKCNLKEMTLSKYALKEGALWAIINDKI